MQISVDWVNNDLSCVRICNVHFTDDDFNHGTKPTLKSTAVPQFNESQIVGSTFHKNINRIFVLSQTGSLVDTSNWSVLMK